MFNCGVWGRLDTLGTSGVFLSQGCGVLKQMSGQVTSLSKGSATRLADERAIRTVHQQVIYNRRRLAEDRAALPELAHKNPPRLRFFSLVGCVVHVCIQLVVLREAVDLAQLHAVVGERVLVQEILKLVWARQLGDQAFFLVQHLDEAVVGPDSHSLKIEGKLICGGLKVRQQFRLLCDLSKVQVAELVREKALDG